MTVGTEHGFVVTGFFAQHPGHFMHSPSTYLRIASCLLVGACSSASPSGTQTTASTSVSTQTGQSSGQSNSTGTQGNSSTNACSCEVSNNGFLATLDCGSSQCVNGTTYTCDNEANASPGSDCDGDIDAGTGTGTGTGTTTATGTDAGTDGGTESDSAPACVAVEQSCSSGPNTTQSDCCTGSSCYSSSSGDTCYLDRGQTCTDSGQCAPGLEDGALPGDTCTGGLCCGSSGAVCAAAGPDTGCCSGTCAAGTGSVPSCQ